ncbi:hypothetical protein HPB48_007743 [Haemaphysalis longicornis]|uniref:Uncharacterized protein n=1 Tax=Haemaphysalis longicornis TaxID=44386 RepID=A0A9J6GTH8_HAELO|nr:hypothetical protein HPB48_007743 [Haemaphysalis longicornis]
MFDGVGAKKKIQASWAHGFLAVWDEGTCTPEQRLKPERRMKLHWVAFNMRNETVRKVFFEYGDVEELRLGPALCSSRCLNEPQCARGVTGPGIFTEKAGSPGALNATPVRTSRLTALARMPGLWGEAWKERTTNSLRTRRWRKKQRRPHNLNPSPPVPKAAAGVATTKKVEDKPLAVDEDIVPAADSPQRVNATAADGESNKDGGEKVDVQVQPNKRRHEECPKAVDDQNQ